MSSDAQNSKCRMIALQDAFAKYYLDTNSVPEVILLTKDFYAILEKDRMNTIGWLRPADYFQAEPRAYRGAKVYLAEDFEIASDFCFMTKEEFSYFKKRQVMFYRLLTNGEWFARGKDQQGRKEALFHEAHGFADMCAGYDRWEEMLQEYLETYPTPPQDA